MKQEEINKNNKLIAEFMNKDAYIMHSTDKLFINRAAPIEVKYHTSWDWLMPVVEKIESLKLGDITINNDTYFNCSVEVEIISSVCNVHLFGSMRVYKDLINVYDQQTKLNAAYEAVIKFINWYNENK